MFSTHLIKQEDTSTEVQDANDFSELCSGFLMPSNDHSFSNNDSSLNLSYTDTTIVQDPAEPSLVGTVPLLKCCFCEFTTVSTPDLEQHLEIHCTGEEFSCGDCSYTSTDPLIFLRHTESHTPLQKYKCNVCSYSASDTFRIKRHLSTHKTEREFKCVFCESSFKDKSGLQSHEKIHSNIKPFKCDFCDYASVRSTSLKQHVRIHTGEKPYVCLYCGHSSAYQRSFKRHLMKEHFQAQPFKCDDCDYTTIEAFRLNRHKQVHMGKDSGLEFNVKEYRCLECPFVTTRNSSLNRHMRIHTGDKPFICNDCGHATAYKNHLELHRMRFHLGLKPHRCSLCDYSASASNQLKRHMLTHAKNLALFKDGNCEANSPERMEVMEDNVNVKTEVDFLYSCDVSLENPEN